MNHAGTWHDAAGWQGAESDRLWRRREAARARVDGLTRVLDQALRVPGTTFRVGLDGLLGLIPGVGDAITTILALWLVYEARQMGAPGHLILRMLGNVAIDFAVGSVPVLGDLFDFAFKANVRNRALLRRHMGV